MNSKCDDIFVNKPDLEPQPILSVLIPFYKESPVALLTALDSQAKDLGHQVEIIVLDDGSAMEKLTQGVKDCVQAMQCVTTFISLGANIGRARGRNRLTQQAKGRYYLFLDSDMLPDKPSFLADWLSLTAMDKTDVAFGGFSLIQAPNDAKFALHRAMALKSDCLSADIRRLAPEKNVFTSNLLVRADIFAVEPFDKGFVGWGWEDVEWGIRVSRRYRIDQVDNTATHMGLDPTQTLIAKYEQSASNFARVLATHHDIVSHFPSAKWAQRLRYLPMRSLWISAFKTMASHEMVPIGLRALSLRFLRACLYAGAMV